MVRALLFSLLTIIPFWDAWSGETKNEVLNKLLQIPEVKAQYDACKAAGTNLNKMDECLWKGSAQVPSKLEGNSAVMKKIKTITESSSAVVPKGKKVYNPGLEALESYFTALLEKELFPEGKDKKDDNALINHKTFNDLYRSQLGKNIIVGLTSYCYDTNITRYFILPEKSKLNSIHSENKAALQDISGDEPAAYGSWANCMRAIQHICYKTHYQLGNEIISYSGDKPRICKEENLVIDEVSGKKDCDKGISDTFDVKKEEMDESRKRACAVTNYLSAVKKDLQKVESIDDIYNSRFSQQDDGPGRNINVDKITGVGSELFDKENEDNPLAKANKKAQEEIQKCLETQNFEKCEKYHKVDDQESEEELIAYSLTSKVKSEQEFFDKEKKLEKEEVVQFLKDEEGLTESQAFEVAEKYEGNIDELREKIKNRYEREREELIKNLASEIGSSTGNPAQDDPKKTLENTLDKIQNELTTRTSEFKDLVRFNNIVSGYLKVEHADGKEASRNISSLLKERDSLDENFRKKLEETGVFKQKDSDDSGASQTSLGVKEINENLLNYD